MAPEQKTPEWRRSLRDVASITTGVFLLINESAVQSQPREIVMYVGALLLTGPAFLRVFGR